MKDTETAASYAIKIARSRGLAEVGPDELLLGCFRALSRFGVVQFGAWTFDLEAFGIAWSQPMPGHTLPKVAYSDAAVAIFDRAAQVARVDGYSEIAVEHILVAFTDEAQGLMGELKRSFGIESAAWRAAAAAVPRAISEDGQAGEPSPAPPARDYLTPEQAAEELGIHVQTLRVYVRTGKLPAMRLAGERALRIRRRDLEQILEPLVPEKQQS